MGPLKSLADLTNDWSNRCPFDAYPSRGGKPYGGRKGTPALRGRDTDRAHRPSDSASRNVTRMIARRAGRSGRAEQEARRTAA